VSALPAFLSLPKITTFMKFFQDCENAEQIKSKYRTLAKKHHPDLGGDEETFKAMNNQYSFVLAKFMRDGKLTAEECENAILENEAYRAAIDAVIHLDGINIELSGTWIWVSGNTRPHSAALKAAKFLWSPNKQEWYFRVAKFCAFNKGKIKSKEEIVHTYGVKEIKGKKYSQVN
jgi:hypothetical protein